MPDGSPDGSTHDAGPGEGLPAVHIGLPENPPRHGWFGGILCGDTGDRDRLERATSAINRIGAVEAHLAFEGPRFSVLFDEEPQDGDRFDRQRLEDLVPSIQELVDSARRPEQVESTLRCTVTFDDHVTEILFAPVAGQVRAVSRSRPPREDDRREITRPADRLALLRGRRGLAIFGLLALLAGLIIWQGGAADYALAPGGADIAHRPGPFDGLLEVDVLKRWPGYTFAIRRGPMYPKTPQESETLEDAAGTNLRLAAVRAVSQGDEIQVRIWSASGQLLRTGVCSLRGLLTGDAPVVTRLAGHKQAAAMDLSLD